MSVYFGKRPVVFDSSIKPLVVGIGRRYSYTAQPKVLIDEEADTVVHIRTYLQNPTHGQRHVFSAKRCVPLA